MGMGKKKEPLIYKGSCGGRNRTRTCDPIDVNDVLYRLSHATISENKKNYSMEDGKMSTPKFHVFSGGDAVRRLSCLSLWCVLWYNKVIHCDLWSGSWR